MVRSAYHIKVTVFALIQHLSITRQRHGVQCGGNHIRCQRTDQRAEAYRSEVSSDSEVLTMFTLAVGSLAVVVSSYCTSDWPGGRNFHLLCLDCKPHLIWKTHGRSDAVSPSAPPAPRCHPAAEWHIREQLGSHLSVRPYPNMRGN